VPCGRPERWLVPRVPTAFGEDAFGRRAQATAALLRHPEVHAGQTVLVIAWIAVNAVAVACAGIPTRSFSSTSALSTQAAYAARPILLAQTRQTDRGKKALDLLEAHRDEWRTCSSARPRSRARQNG
jgi:uncharacterized membrane protein